MILLHYFIELKSGKKGIVNENKNDKEITKELEKQIEHIEKQQNSIIEDRVDSTKVEKIKKIKKTKLLNQTDETRELFIYKHKQIQLNGISHLNLDYGKHSPFINPNDVLKVT